MNHPILVISVLEIHMSTSRFTRLKIILYTVEFSKTVIFSRDLNNQVPRFSTSIRRIFGSLNGVSSYSCIL